MGCGQGGAYKNMNADPAGFAHQKVIFLDRDGVINEQAPIHDYIKRWEDFKFLPGVIEALRLLKESNYRIYIISNQQGIARKMMSEETLKVIHANMQQELAAHGASVDGIYYCPHGKDEMCSCRKPNPGMLLRAAKENNIRLADALFIGDAESDMLAGERAGCKTVFLKAPETLLGIVNKLLEGQKASV